jgi:hypothetical protein
MKKDYINPSVSELVEMEAEELMEPSKHGGELGARERHDNEWDDEWDDKE